MRLGMDVARLNFSHGTHQDHAHNIERLRNVAQQEGRSICILQDLQGPKIRTGRSQGRRPDHDSKPDRGHHHVPSGGRDRSVISTTFKDLPREVQAGSRILLSDGLIELRVSTVRGDERRVPGHQWRVAWGSIRESILPGAALSIPALTDKDRRDLNLAWTTASTWLRYLSCARPLT